MGIFFPQMRQGTQCHLLRSRVGGHPVPGLWRGQRGRAHPPTLHAPLLHPCPASLPLSSTSSSWEWQGKHGVGTQPPESPTV